MQWIPRNYQLESLSFLLTNPNSGLFEDPGLGKTSSCLSAIRILKDAGKITGALVVAPKRVAYLVWPYEIQKWDNFKSLTIANLHEDRSLLWTKADIYVINPEALNWLMVELLDKLGMGWKCPFNSLWVDESTKFKNHKSKRFSILISMLPLFKRRHILTGTPAPRNYIDLWSQQFILDEGKALTDNFYRFRKKYFYTNEWEPNTWLLKEGADIQIQKAISPNILDLAQEDHLNIPPITTNNIYVQMSSSEYKLYKDVENKMFASIDGGEVSASSVALATMKCQQIANGSVYEDIPDDLDEEGVKEFKKTRKTLFCHKRKIEAVTDLFEELGGKPLLVAYHYRHDLTALLDAFGANTPCINGATSERNLAAIERDWNLGKLPLLLCQPVSMGHGLNMQARCQNICWFGLTWDLEVYIQFNKRVHRSGVKGRVTLHHIIAKDTVDEVIVSVLGIRGKRQRDFRKALREYRLRATSTPS